MSILMVRSGTNGYNVQRLFPPCLFHMLMLFSHSSIYLKLRSVEGWECSVLFGESFPIQSWISSVGWERAGVVKLFPSKERCDRQCGVRVN